MNFFKWIKSLFTSTAPINNSGPVNKTEPVESKAKSGINKIAILVGHGAGDSGAIAWNNVEEHTYNTRVAETIAQSDLGKEIKVFYKTKSGWGPTYLKIGLFKPDLTIELHLNAANGSAVGCEVLCLEGDSRSMFVGRSFAKTFTEKFNRKLRREQGINSIAKGDRGFGNIKGCKVISSLAILVEPFFCDNKNEWIESQDYAEFLKEWIKGL